MTHIRPMSASWLVSLSGKALLAEEREVLRHPIVAGVVLFAENYASKIQLIDLIASIKAERADCWITVDQEGGRVTRFQGADYGAPLVSAQTIGEVYARDASDGLRLAQEVGHLNATQLKSVGVDALLGPVFDLYRGGIVLAGRCFGNAAPDVIALLRAYLMGMEQANLGAVGKHFPGHGVVTEDTHIQHAQTPVSLDLLETADLQPYVDLMSYYQGIMCGHVVYSSVDSKPASFSSVWMEEILRQRMGFEGVIVSDCLSMAAAQPDQYIENLWAVSQAGCDLIICSHVSQQGINYSQLLSSFEHCPSKAHAMRVAGLTAPASTAAEQV